jgi:hypothetical protein
VNRGGELVQHVVADIRDRDDHPIEIERDGDGDQRASGLLVQERGRLGIGGDLPQVDIVERLLHGQRASEVALIEISPLDKDPAQSLPALDLQQLQGFNELFVTQEVRL